MALSLPPFAAPAPPPLGSTGPRPALRVDRHRTWLERLRAADARGATHAPRGPIAVAAAANADAPSSSSRRRSSLADDLRGGPGGPTGGRREGGGQPLPLFDDDDDDDVYGSKIIRERYDDEDDEHDDANDNRNDNANSNAAVSSSPEVRLMRAARRVRTWEDAALLAERGPSAILLDGQDEEDWTTTTAGAADNNNHNDDDDWAAPSAPSSSSSQQRPAHHHHTWSAVMLTAASVAASKLPPTDEEEEGPASSSPPRGSRTARNEAAMRKNEARRRGDALAALRECAGRLLGLDALDAAAAANVLLSLTRARAIDPLETAAVNDDEDDEEEEQQQGGALSASLLRAAAARAEEFGPLETGSLLAAARCALERRVAAASERKAITTTTTPLLLDATVGAVLAASAAKASSSSSSLSSLAQISRSLAALAASERALAALRGSPFASPRLGGTGRDAWVLAAADACCNGPVLQLPSCCCPRALARLAASLAQLLLAQPPLALFSCSPSSVARALAAAAERAAPGMGPSEAAAVARALGLLFAAGDGAPPFPALGPQLYRRCARLMPAPPGAPKSQGRRGRRARLTDKQALAVLVGMARAERAAEQEAAAKAKATAEGKGDEQQQLRRAPRPIDPETCAALADLVRRALWWAGGQVADPPRASACALAVALATLVRATKAAEEGAATVRPDAVLVSRLRDACSVEQSSPSRRASKAVARALAVLQEAAACAE